MIVLLMPRTGDGWLLFLNSLSVGALWQQFRIKDRRKAWVLCELLGFLRKELMQSQNQASVRGALLAHPWCGFRQGSTRGLLDRLLSSSRCSRVISHTSSFCFRYIVISIFIQALKFLGDLPRRGLCTFNPTAEKGSASY